MLSFRLILGSKRQEKYHFYCKKFFFPMKNKNPVPTP